LVVSTESINPKYWNKETQRAKKSQEFREHPEFNTIFPNIEATIQNLYRKYQNDNDHAVPDPLHLKELLDRHLRKKEVNTSNDDCEFVKFLCKSHVIFANRNNGIAFCIYVAILTCSCVCNTVKVLF